MNNWKIKFKLLGELTHAVLTLVILLIIAGVFAFNEIHLDGSSTIQSRNSLVTGMVVSSAINVSISPPNGSVFYFGGTSTTVTLSASVTGGSASKVEFYSIGEGIDFKTKEDFDKFLNTYTKKLVYEPASWGREGEIDYCLKINELSPAEQTDFVKKAKELLSRSKLVHVNENAKCVHKH